MCMLALDPGSEKTGYAAGHLIDEKFSVFKHGVLVAPAKVGKRKATYEDRVRALGGMVDDLINAIGPVDELILEMPHSNARNIQSSLKVAMLTGVYWGIAIKHGIQAVHMYPPSEWKVGIVGKGNATKDEVMLMVLGRYGVSIKNYDESDAFAILSYHWESAWERILS